MGGGGEGDESGATSAKSSRIRRQMTNEGSYVNHSFARGIVELVNDGRMMNDDCPSRGCAKALLLRQEAI